VTQVTIEKGKTLGIKTLAMAEDLTSNGEREVFFEMNGQLRSVFIKDKEAVKVCSKQGWVCKIWEQLKVLHTSYLKKLYYHSCFFPGDVLFETDHRTEYN
jgi:hypothetical protein